jgi:hypothetical protein
MTSIVSSERISILFRRVDPAVRVVPLREVVFMQSGMPLARLPAGDPVLQMLALPVENVERLRDACSPAIANSQATPETVDVILAYLRQQADRL